MKTAFTARLFSKQERLKVVQYISGQVLIMQASIKKLTLNINLFIKGPVTRTVLFCNDWQIQTTQRIIWPRSAVAGNPRDKIALN